MKHLLEAAFVRSFGSIFSEKEGNVFACEFISWLSYCFSGTMAVFLIFEEIERKVETKTILLSALANLLCACFVKSELLFV